MRKSVLLVDDYRLMGQLVTFYLMNEYDVICATSGFEAMSRLIYMDSTEQMDDLAAVLLDVVMPDSDGFELLTEIRERFPDLPVLMCSALDMREDVSRAMKMGAAGFIAKPFDRDALRMKLATVTCTQEPVTLQRVW